MFKNKKETREFLYILVLITCLVSLIVKNNQYWIINLLLFVILIWRENCLLSTIAPEKKNSIIILIIMIIGTYLLITLIINIIIKIEIPLHKSKTEEFYLYKEAYIPSSIKLEYDHKDNITKVIDLNLNTNLNYTYKYDNNKITELMFDGVLNSVETYGSYEFIYDNDKISKINTTINNYDYEAKTTYEYIYKNDKLVKFESHTQKPFDDIDCFLTYYNNYTIEECYNGNYSYNYNGAIYNLNIYLNDELKEKDNIWNTFNLKPFSFYDYHYSNINTRSSIINVPHTESLLYLGKLLYHEEKENNLKMTYRQYYDKDNRIIKDKIAKYKYDNDGNVELLYKNNEKYYKQQIKFNQNGYTNEQIEINAAMYNRNEKKFDNYYNQNVVNYDIDKVLDNLSAIFQNNYEVDFYEYPEVTIKEDIYKTAIIPKYTLLFNNVNSFKFLLNNEDVTELCDVDSDNTKLYRCYLSSDYIKIGHNEVDILLSNKAYQDISYKDSFEFLPYEVEIFADDEVDFVNYGSKIRAPKLNLSASPKSYGLKYTIEMDDIQITDTFNSDYGIAIELTEFAKEKYDKTGPHKAILTVEDSYKRKYTKEIIFNYK